jgi:hypothetical protein
VAIAESYLPRLDAAIVGSPCETVTIAVSTVIQDMKMAQCEYDLEGYGFAEELTLEGCLAQ